MEDRPEQFSDAGKISGASVSVLTEAELKAVCPGLLERLKSVKVESMSQHLPKYDRELVMKESHLQFIEPSNRCPNVFKLVTESVHDLQKCMKCLLDCRNVS